MIRRLSILYMVLSAIFVALPIVVVCASALNGGRAMLFPPRNPTLSRFAEFFVTETVWVTALQNSVIIATGAAVLATLLAWPIAYLVWKRNDAMSRLIAGLASMPFALPPIVFGVGLSFLWSFSTGLGEVWAGIVSHAAFFLALPLVMITIGLQSIDRAHLDAAATMGASESVVFRTVVFPQTTAYTASAFFFVLVLSFNEFIIMFFVSSSAYATVTLQIFNSLRNGFTPTMAVGAITFIFSSIVIFSMIARYGNLPRLLGADDSRSS